MKERKGLNIFWSMVFIIGIVWILIRKTVGAVQNFEIRMINLLVLVIAVILVGICHLAIRYFIKKSSIFKLDIWKHQLFPRGVEVKGIFEKIRLIHLSMKPFLRDT